jgi:hypothetical protein
MQQAANDRLGTFGSQFWATATEADRRDGLFPLLTASAASIASTRAKQSAPANAGSPGGHAPSPDRAESWAITFGQQKRHGFRPFEFFGQNTDQRSECQEFCVGANGAYRIYQIRRCERRRPCQTEAASVSFGPLFRKVFIPTKAKRSASSLIKGVLIPPVRPDTFCMAKNRFPAGPGSSPVPSARPHHATRVRPRCGPSADGGSGAFERLTRAPAAGPDGVQPNQIIQDFRAMPAAKAASASVTSRPFGRTHAGRPDRRAGNEEGATGSESMRETLHRIVRFRLPKLRVSAQHVFA